MENCFLKLIPFIIFSQFQSHSAGSKLTTKDDLNKRLHSTVVVKKTHSPDLNWENWDQTDLEYEDEKVLEKRRQLLQRELELQMKREKEEQQRQKKEKKNKKVYYIKLVIKLKLKSDWTDTTHAYVRFFCHSVNTSQRWSSKIFS